MRIALLWITGGFLFFGCARPDIDLDGMSFFGLPLSSSLTLREIVHVLGPPENRSLRERFLWKPPQLFLQYYRKGLEIAFDSEGREWDPRSSQLRQIYIFLQPEQEFHAFRGGISKRISPSWDVEKLASRMGPPERKREVWNEIEWWYSGKGEFEILVIADQGSKRIKALMIIRKNRERSR